MSAATNPCQSRRDSRVTNRVDRGRLFRRLCWAGLFLMHVVALPAVWSALADAVDLPARIVIISRFLGMSAATVFFVLKIIDVRWLRMNPGWRSAVAAIVVVALVHVGAIDRAMNSTSDIESARLGLVLFIGTLWSFDRLVRALRPMLAALLSAGVLRMVRDLSVRSRAWADIVPRAIQFDVPSLAGPRAPPLG